MGDLLDEISYVLDDGDGSRYSQRPPLAHPQPRRFLTQEYYEQQYHRPNDHELDDFDRQVLQDDIPQQRQPAQSRSSQHLPDRFQSSQSVGYPSRVHGTEGNLQDARANSDLRLLTQLGRQRREIGGSSRGSLMTRFGFQEGNKRLATPEVRDDDRSTAYGFSSPTSQYQSQYNLPKPRSPFQRARPVKSLPKITPSHPTKQQQQQTPESLIVRGIQLVSVDQLPDRFRAVFPYPLFNAVQSRCFNSVYYTNSNIVVSAPTGAGKTVILELAICGLFKDIEQVGTYKVIYLAPTKALCTERRKDWEKKFRVLGLTCTELTGDTDQAQISNVRKGDIIVTTPEKWDSITRRWEDHRKLLDLVRLFLVDEVHILKESRGATLEAVVSRMRSIGSNVRFVALSATVPNAGDIADWLGKGREERGEPAIMEVFGPEFRPVRLEKFVYGFQSHANDFAFDKILDTKLPEILYKHSAGKPVMVFCMTRNICVSTAKNIAEKWKTIPSNQKPWFVQKNNLPFKDRELQNTVACGVAYHHAGLESNDRNLIENEFINGGLMVICCTSTLAVGVNLPAHLVIIKNTVSWQENGTKEYADLEIMQMLGRAGRPQFDDSGVAVILTRKEKVEKYERMDSGMEILESCLHKNLIEHLNAEIGLRTITNVESAQEWIRSTFLYTRLKKNPGYYNLEGQTFKAGSEQRAADISSKDLALLVQEGLVDRTPENLLRSTKYGESMARYYIRFGTMVKILKMDAAPKMTNMLMTLSQAEEFSELRLRSGEKALYKEINRGNDIRFPLKMADICLPSHKVYIIIQAEIGGQEFPLDQNFQKLKTSMIQDRAVVFQHCHRIISAMVDCMIYKEDGKGLINALDLARCLKARVWEGSAHELRQLDGLGPVAVRKMINSGVRSLRVMEEMQSHQIESILSRNPPFGTNMLKLVRSIPNLKIGLGQVGKLEYKTDPIPSVVVKLSAKIEYLNAGPPMRFKGAIIYGTFVAIDSEGQLLTFKKMPIFQLEGGKEIKFGAELTMKDQVITCVFSCDQIAGTTVTAEFKPDIKPSFKFPAKKQVADKDKPIPETLVGEGMMEKPVMPTSEPMEDDYGSVDFNDSDMEQIDQLTFSHKKLEVPVTKFETYDVDDELYGFPHEKFLVKLEAKPTSTQQSNEWVQLPNGNWQCRHKCADKSKCKHMCCREGLERPPRMPKGMQPVRINSLTMGCQSVQATQTASSTAASRERGPKTISKRPKQSFQDPASELLQRMKTTPRELLPFEREKEEGSLSKLQRLHEKTVPGTGISVKRLSGQPKFGLGSGEKRERHIATEILSSSDDDDDDDVPSLKRRMASTTSNVIRTGLKKQYRIALDDKEDPGSPTVPTSTTCGISHIMDSPDHDGEEENTDIDAWLDKEMEKHDVHSKSPPGPEFPALSCSSPSPLERPTKRKKHEHESAESAQPALFKVDLPLSSSPSKLESDDLEMFDVGMNFGEMLPMTKMDKMLSMMDGDNTETMDIMDILGDCVVFEDGP